MTIYLVGYTDADGNYEFKGAYSTPELARKAAWLYGGEVEGSRLDDDAEYVMQAKRWFRCAVLKGGDMVEFESYHKPGPLDLEGIVPWNGASAFICYVEADSDRNARMAARRRATLAFKKEDKKYA